MKKIILAASILCFSFNAAAVCKNASSLKGNYIFSSNYVGNMNGKVVNCGVVGQLYFDGKGASTISHISGCGGVLPLDGLFGIEKGSYTLDSMCSGKTTFSANTEEEMTFSYIFDSKLNSASFIVNSPNNLTAAGTLIKQ